MGYHIGFKSLYSVPDYSICDLYFVYRVVASASLAVRTTVSAGIDQLDDVVASRLSVLLQIQANLLLPLTDLSD